MRPCCIIWIFFTHSFGSRESISLNFKILPNLNFMIFGRIWKQEKFCSQKIILKSIQKKEISQFLWISLILLDKVLIFWVVSKQSENSIFFFKISVNWFFRNFWQKFLFLPLKLSKDSFALFFTSENLVGLLKMSRLSTCFEIVNQT